MPDFDDMNDEFDGDYEDFVEEIAMEAGMLGGVEAYNEVRGYDVEDMEPCGHHCDDSCPRCGGE